MNDEKGFPKGKPKIRIQRKMSLKIRWISDLQKTLWDSDSNSN